MAAHRELRATLTDPAPVMEAAAAFVAVRPRSVAETTRRLARLGYPDPLVSEVVTRLIEMAILDDAEFCRAWVESRDRARPKGTAGLKRELQLKGVDRETVDAVLAERSLSTDTDVDMTGAAALVERKRASLEREPDPYRRRQKAYALLARNGFDPETCRAAAALVAPRIEE